MLLSCVRQPSRQRVWARPEAPPRLALAQTHAFVLIQFAQAVLKILGVEVTQPNALQVGRYCRAQPIKLLAPAAFGPRRVDRAMRKTLR